MARTAGSVLTLPAGWGPASRPGTGAKRARARQHGAGWAAGASHTKGVVEAGRTGRRPMCDRVRHPLASFSGRSPGAGLRPASAAGGPRWSRILASSMPKTTRAQAAGGRAIFKGEFFRVVGVRSWRRGRGHENGRGVCFPGPPALGGTRAPVGRTAAVASRHHVDGARAAGLARRARDGLSRPALRGVHRGACRYWGRAGGQTRQSSHLLSTASRATASLRSMVRSYSRRTAALAAHSPESCASDTAMTCLMSDSRRLSNRVPS